MKGHAVSPKYLPLALVAVLIFLAMQLSAQTLVTWTNVVGCTVSNDTLKKTATTGSSNGGASSVDWLAPSTDGYVQFCKNNVSATFIVGLSQADLNQNYSSIGYAMYYDGTSINIYESDYWRGSFGTVSAGDTLRLERSGGNILYKKNGTTLRTVTTTASYRLIIDATIYTQNAFLSNVRTNFTKGLRLDYAVTDIVPPATTGGISLTPLGGTSPYTYSWSNGSTTQNPTGLAAGAYTVTVTDNASATVTQGITVGYQVAWENTVNATGSGNGLVSTSTTLEAGASSRNYIPAGGNGYLEFTVDEAKANTYAIGLSEKEWGADLFSMEYGIYANGGTFYIYESYSLKYTIGALVAGDVCRVERSGDTVKYYVNGVLKRSVAADTGEEMVMDAWIYGAGNLGDIANIRTNIGLPFGLRGTVTARSTTANDGAVTLDVRGGTSGYTYAWSNGATTQNISGLNTGTYTVTVTDAASATATKGFEVGYQLVWENTSNVTTTGSSVVSTNTYSTWNGGAASRNYIPAGSNGYVQYTVTKGLPYVQFVIGLSERDIDRSPNSNEYGLYQYTGNVILYESGAQRQTVAIKQGDRLRVERYNDTIKYSVNGTVKRSVAADHNETLLVDISLGKSAYAGLTAKALNITTNIGVPYGTRATVTDQVPAQTKTGSIALEVLGGSSTFTYAWSNGKTTQNLDSLDAGTYTVTVTDAASATTTKSYTVGYQIQWQNVTNGTTAANSVTATSATGGASTKNFLNLAESGYIEHVVEEGSITQYSFGLSEIDPSTSVASMQFGFYKNGNNYQVYESGSGRVTSTPVKVGDRLKVQRDGDTIRYKVNDYQIRAVYTDKNKVLMGDMGWYSNIPVIGYIKTNAGSVVDPNTYYWTGKTSTSWSNTGNWSRYPGGSSAGSLPGSTNTVDFNQYGVVDCNLDANITVGAISINSGYTATISNSSYNFTSSGQVLQYGGHFNGGSGTLNFGSLKLYGGTFQSSSGTLNLSGDFVETSALFTHHSGTIEFSNDGSANCVSQLYNLQIDASKNLTLNSDLKVANVLTLSAGKITLNSKTLKLLNGASSAIANTSGKIIAESSDFSGNVEWSINENTGTYVLPFFSVAGDNQTLSYQVVNPGIVQTSSQKGTLVFSTYLGNSSNIPLPVNVPNILNVSNAENSAKMLSRYWSIKAAGYSYEPDFSPILQYSNADISGKTITQSNLVAQVWNDKQWQAAEGTTNTTNKQLSVTNTASYGEWAIVDNSSLLRTDEVSYFVINNTDQPGVSFTISGGGLSGTYAGSGIRKFYPTIDATTHFSSVTVDFTGFSSIGSLRLTFDIGSNSVTDNYQLRLSNGTGGWLDPKAIAGKVIKLTGKDPHEILTKLSEAAGAQAVSDNCQDDINSIAGNNQRNWVYSTIYNDIYGPKSEAIQYYDLLGRPTQSQTKLKSEGIVLANQVIYDEFGRGVLKTLPAPLKNTCFKFAPEFITRTDGFTQSGGVLDPYKYQNINLNDPFNLNLYPTTNLAILAQKKGTLGYYYSNLNQEEPYVPASGYPFSRVGLTSDPISSARFVTSPGEALTMGGGHEVRTFTMGSANELAYMYGGNKSYILDDDATNPLHGKYREINDNLVSRKTITVDQDGNTKITFVNDLDQVIATCRSGIASTCTTGTGVGKMLQPIPYYGTRSVDIHLPASKKGTLVLPADGGNSPYNNVSGTYNYAIYDLENDYLLVSGTDYTYNSSTGAVTFINSYISPVKQNFFRITLSISPEPNDQQQYLTALIQYEEDYTNWSLNYYDNKGQVRKTVSPQGINECNLVSDPTKLFYNSYLQSVLISGFVPASIGGYHIGTSAPDILDETVVATSTLVATPSHYNEKRRIQISATSNTIDLGNGVVSIDPNDCLNDVGNSQLPPLTDLIARSFSFTNGMFSNGTSNPFVPDDRSDQVIGILPNSNITINNGVANKTFSQTGSGTPRTSAGTPQGGIATICGEPSKSIIFFKFGMNLYLDNSLVNTSGPQYFDAHIQSQCCKFWFVTDNPTVFELNNTQLTGKAEIEYKIATVEVSYNGTDYYTFDPTYKYQDLVRFAQISINSGRTLYPVSDPDQYTMADYFLYDNYGKLIASQTVDQGIAEFKYDDKLQLRFSQNAQQRTDGKFSYINYDKAGRTVEAGEYTQTSGNLNFYPDAVIFPSLTAPTGTNITTELAHPISAPTYTAQQTNFMYDIPDNSLPSGFPSGYDQHYIMGKASKSWNANITTWYSYDALGRVEWRVQKINDLSKWVTFNYQYDLLGNPTMVTYQKDAADEFFQHHFFYDADMRLSKVYTSTDYVSQSTSASQFQFDFEALAAAGTHGVKRQAAYEYYQHGALKRVELAKDLQGLDYVYTIDGWLKAINDPDLVRNDPGHDGATTTNAQGKTVKNSFAKDVFGMTLDYFAGDYTRQDTKIQTFGGDMVDNTISATHIDNPVAARTSSNYNVRDHFNGLVKDIRWQTETTNIGGGGGAVSITNKTPNPDGSITPIANMYGYEYDAFGRLKDAVYGNTYGGTQNNSGYTGTGIVAPTMRVHPEYRVTGMGSNYGIDYDKNGNILSMRTDGKAAALNRDQMTYHYLPDGTKPTNRLDYVEEGVMSVYSDDHPYGQATGNYEYDKLGRMKTDIKQNIDMVYDAYSHVTDIYVHGTTQHIMQFLYDEGGKRLKKTAYDASGVHEKDTWYIGSNVYEKDYAAAIPTLYQTQVALFGGSRIGCSTFNIDGSGHRLKIKDIYEIADQVGNIRATIDGQKTNGKAMLVSYADYYPFGSLLPNQSYSTNAYRYSYQGQERDEKTGLLAFELRNYNSNLGRWTTPDPYRQFWSPYLAMANNPISFTDHDGGQTGVDDASGNGQAKGKILEFGFDPVFEALVRAGRSANYDDFDYFGMQMALKKQLLWAGYSAQEINKGWTSSQLVKYSDDYSKKEIWTLLHPLGYDEGYQSSVIEITAKRTPKMIVQSDPIEGGIQGGGIDNAVFLATIKSYNKLFTFVTYTGGAIAYSVPFALGGMGAIGGMGFVVFSSDAAFAYAEQLSLQAAANAAAGAGAGGMAAANNQNVINTLEDLVQAVYNFRQLKESSQLAEGWVSGSRDAVFNILSKGSQISEIPRGWLAKLPNGITLTSYSSLYGGDPTIQLNANGNITKIRFTEW